jgi:siroheme synthase
MGLRQRKRIGTLTTGENCASEISLPAIIVIGEVVGDSKSRFYEELKIKSQYG